MASASFCFDLRSSGIGAALQFQGVDGAVTNHQEEGKQLNRRISVACVQASYKIWRMHSGGINPGDTLRNSSPTVPGTPDPPSRPVTTNNPVSSTVGTPTSTGQPRRASTRWGPPRASNSSAPVSTRRTSTRWETRRDRVASSTAPEVQPESRQQPRPQHSTQTSRPSGRPHPSSAQERTRSSRQHRRGHPQVRRDGATATRN